MGLFEYMQLAEDLGAEPVWVVNNGVSHEESVPAGHIQSWVQDALDSIECAALGASALPTGVTSTTTLHFHQLDMPARPSCLVRIQA